MRKLATILAVLAISGVAMGASNGIVELNYGIDRNNVGTFPPTPGPGVWSSSGNLGGGISRDNIKANGDNWLATNAGIAAKHTYGTNTGTTANFGFVGCHVGATGDTAEVYYTFTAPSAITLQDWAIKGIVLRVLGRAARMQFSVDVNGGGYTQVDMSNYFSDTAGGAPNDMGSTTSGFCLDGPVEYRTADLSALGIVAGDTVKYKFRMPQNDGGGFGQRKNIGLGIALIPEPATMVLLAVGGLVAIRRRK
jgi:hypothetical protein